MNIGNNLILLLISIFIINFIISYNITDNFNDGKTATVFAQETASGQFSTYTNEKYGITMQYPSDWTKSEDVKVEEDYADEGYNDEFEGEDYNQIRIVEIYSNKAAYELHLKTPHFLLYKTSTTRMVKSLKLVDMEALDNQTLSAIFKKAK